MHVSVDYRVRANFQETAPKKVKLHEQACRLCSVKLKLVKQVYPGQVLVSQVDGTWNWTCNNLLQVSINNYM